MATICIVHTLRDTHQTLNVGNKARATETKKQNEKKTHKHNDFNVGYCSFWTSILFDYILH